MVDSFKNIYLSQFYYYYIVFPQLERNGLVYFFIE